MNDLQQALAPLLAQPDAAVLMLAPHPDDETLGAGGLLQRAAAAGARVQVALLTDGDNNPWPQRWTTRRWTIDGAARAAWGARRRAEAAAALRALGLRDADLLPLGWPDQGISERIADACADSVARLRALLLATRPTLLVAPVLEDHHPDHSAARVLLEAALAGIGLPHPPLWGFAVHGRAPAVLALPLQAAETVGKLRALECHRSQLLLAGGRWRRRVHAGEFYQRVAPSALPITDAVAALPWRPAAAALQDARLLVVTPAASWQLPWRDGAQAGPLRLHLGAQPQLLLTAPQPALWIKLYSARRNAWIFDHWGWRRYREAA